MGSKEIIRVALIGCGDIAETGHLPAIREHERFELLAACDVRKERAQLLAGLAGGITAVTDYRQLAVSKEIDAFILALHPEHSVDVAIDLLNRGKHVLDEKPLARTLEDGLRLARAAAEARSIYQIGFVFRDSAFVSDVAARVRSLGRPSVVYVGVYDERLDRGNRAHFDKIQGILAKSSAITHEGSHVIDFSQKWNDASFVSIAAAATRTESDLNGPNMWSAALTHADGSILQLNVGWMLPDFPESSLRAIGPRGWLDVSLRSGDGSMTHDGATTAFQTQPLLQNWRAQLDHFAAAIDSGVPHGATVEDGLRALRATLACEQAAGVSAHRQGGS